VHIHLRILAASVVAALLTLFTAAIAYVLAAPLPPGDHTIFVKHGGRERSAVVHVPPRAEGSGIYPGLID
jgi:poly(3-hydroxybutyrate) depolymerase